LPTLFGFNIFEKELMMKRYEESFSLGISHEDVYYFVLSMIDRRSSANLCSQMPQTKSRPVSSNKNAVRTRYQLKHANTISI
jgi:hypothetical protein